MTTSTPTMTTSTTAQWAENVARAIVERADQRFQRSRRDLWVSMDRLFAALMAGQWVFGLVLAAHGVAVGLGRQGAQRQPARAGGTGDRHAPVRHADRARVPAARLGGHAPRDRRRADAVVGAARAPHAAAASRRTSTCSARSASWPAIATGPCCSRRPWWSRSSTSCAASCGPSRSTASSTPSGGASSSTPSGSCSRSRSS